MKIDLNKPISPIQLSDDEKPVKVLKCSKGFWLINEQGEFIKNELGKLVVISNKEAYAARERYFTNFRDEYIEGLIKAEEERLINKTKAKAEEFIKDREKILKEAGIIEDLVTNIARNYFGLASQERAKEIAASKGFMESYELVKKLYDAKNYDALYINFFQDGLPEIASFKFDKISSDFNAENIMQTIDNITTKSYIYNVAKYKVENENDI